MEYCQTATGSPAPYLPPTAPGYNPQYNSPAPYYCGPAGAPPPPPPPQAYPMMAPPQNAYYSPAPPPQTNVSVPVNIQMQSAPTPSFTVETSDAQYRNQANNNQMTLFLVGWLVGICLFSLLFSFLSFFSLSDNYHSTGWYIGAFSPYCSNSPAAKYARGNCWHVCNCVMVGLDLLAVGFIILCIVLGMFL